MIYELSIKDGICVSIDGKSFVKNRLADRSPQNAIYVFRNREEIIYVGETGRGVYRCIDGLTCNENQSVAYPWRSHRDTRNSNLMLLIVGVGLPATMAIKKSSREVVESDVASAIFAKNGSWPIKLSALKVHGGIKRTKSYTQAVDKILKKLTENSWV